MNTILVRIFFTHLKVKFDNEVFFQLTSFFFNLKCKIFLIALVYFYFKVNHRQCHNNKTPIKFISSDEK